MSAEYPPWPDLLRWLNTLKDRVETIPAISAEQIVAGVFPETAIPDLPFDRIQLTTAPRLLGRTTGGSGDAEEIRVSGGLSLSGGILSVAGLPSGFEVGDLLYAISETQLARLADVSAGSYLRSGGVETAPLWSTLKLPNTATTGDLPYASAANTISMLADVATGYVLSSGGVGVAPFWGPATVTYEPLTNGDPAAPEILFDSDGDVIMVPM